MCGIYPVFTSFTYKSCHLSYYAIVLFYTSSETDKGTSDQIILKSVPVDV